MFLMDPVGDQRVEKSLAAAAAAAHSCQSARALPATSKMTRKRNSFTHFAQTSRGMGAPAR